MHIQASLSDFPKAGLEYQITLFASASLGFSCGIASKNG
jgi:hypothetical protein